MFENIISLGNACHVASGLARLGLRSFSGPFDWVISDFEGAMKAIQEEFNKFLDIDVLEPCGDSTTIYLNGYYNITFFHDFKSNIKLEKQIESIRSKYNKRIQRFYEAISNKTLFIRYISSQKELDYIASEYQTIQDTLKRYHPENEIIYIGSNSLIDDKLRIYKVTEINNDWTYGLFFDSNEELLNRLGAEIYDLQKRNDNLNHYIRRQINKTEKFKKNYQYLIKLIKLKQSGVEIGTYLKENRCKKVAIYGCGEIGRILYQELIKDKIEIGYFIDDYHKDTTYLDIQIVKSDSFLEEVDIIINTVIEDNIMIKDTLSKATSCPIITIEDLIGNIQ